MVFMHASLPMLNSFYRRKSMRIPALVNIVGWVLLLMVLVPCVKGQDTSFNMPVVQQNGNLIPLEDAVYNSSPPSYVLNGGGGGTTNPICGRLLYKDPVRMVDKATGAVASFSTSFSFSFQSKDNTTCGDGMVFSFVLNSTGLSSEDHANGGGGFCAVDFRTNASSYTSQHVFAVEFDSYYNFVTPAYDMHDVSDGHIGVDFKNTSLGTFNLCPNDVQSCSYFCDTTGNQSFTAWIEYNSTTHILEVRFANSTGTRRPVAAVITVPNLRFDEALQDEFMFVGFSGSTGRALGIHQILSWNFSSTGIPGPGPSPQPSSPAPSTAGSPDPPHSTRKSSSGLIGGISAGFVVAVLLLALLIFVFRKKGPFSEKHGQKKFSIELPDNTSRPFSYRELSSFTKNFSDSELLSSGGFGDVFKGTLSSGALVAVKRIKPNKKEGEESFLAEATSLRQIRHRNLLQLRGWCQAKEGLLLVYDFMCNGSLDRWIYRNPWQDLMGDPSVEAQGLSWNVRWSILSGVASGLAYLHEEWVQCVLHRDIKASNVLLDAGFNAYLGDFGLARLVDHDVMHKTTLLAGTLGYMAPEMHSTGRATTETDVYAYGILLLEVVCGRRALLIHPEVVGDEVLVDSVWRAHEAGHILRVTDPRLFDHADNDDSNSELRRSGDLIDKMTIVKVLQLGLLCCLPAPENRPSMRFVRQWFQSEGIQEFPGLPATKPQSGHYDVNYALRERHSSSGYSPPRPSFTPRSFQSQTSSSGSWSQAIFPGSFNTEMGIVSH